MTDDKALVERLRDEDSYYRIQEKHWCIDDEELERQRLTAADRIEALTAENERLRGALTFIAAPASVSVTSHMEMYKGWRAIATGRIDVARAALGDGE